MRLVLTMLTCVYVYKVKKALLVPTIYLVHTYTHGAMPGDWHVILPGMSKRDQRRGSFLPH